MFVKLKSSLQTTRVIKSIEFQFTQVAALYTNKTMHHCMFSPIPARLAALERYFLEKLPPASLLAGWANL